MNITADVLPIDPDLAREMLARPAVNRPLNRATVRRYAAAMQRGEWIVTPHGVLLDPAGAVIDGQHRLAAIVEAQVTVTLAVYFDIDPGVFAVLDSGRRRSGADTLALEGERDTAVLAAALRYLHLYLTYPEQVWTGTITSITNTELRELLDQHPDMRGAVERGRRIASAIDMIPSAAAVAIYITERWSDTPTSDLAHWYTGVTTGAGLELGSPALALREAMRRVRDRTSTRRYRDTRAHLALYLRAFHAWSEGETMHRLQMPAHLPRFTSHTAAA